MGERPLRPRIDLRDETEEARCYLRWDQIDLMEHGSAERDAALLEWVKYWGAALTDTLRPHRPA